MRRVRRHARRPEREAKKTESEGPRLVEERVERERIFADDDGKDAVDEKEDDE